MSDCSTDMERYFGPKGLLAERLKGFEFRALQLDMAKAVAQCVRGEVPLLAEAGTGTGKTLAYLIPAIESGKKVVVSTGTKTLQDQIFDHDIPLLKKLFFPQLRAVCLKGRKNYLCLRRFGEFAYQPTFWKQEETRLFHRLQKWAARTKTGDRAEIPWLPDNYLTWNAVSSGSEQCLGQQCPEHSRCFLARLRQEAFRSSLIVVNHHLFFADLALRGKELGEVIPDYQAAVFDEAHQLEDIIGLYFGLQFSNLRVNDLLYDILREIQKNVKQLRQMGDIQATCHHLEALCRQLHHSFSRLSGSNGRARLDAERVGSHLSETSDLIVNALEQLSASLRPFLENQPVLESCNRRSLELAHVLRQIVEQQDDSLIYWYELTQQGIFLHGTPVELGSILSRELFQRTSALVFTSATMSAAGSFEFFRERLGIPTESTEMMLPSPFNFDEQAMLYIPSSFSSPLDAQFCTRMAEEALKILAKTRGRALFLFTSYKNLNLVHQALESRLPYPILVQGQRPKRVLLNEFKQQIESVLLATSSFWQGIDVPGESLSCVLIDKLPFEVPDDPITAARMDAVTQQGKNPFYSYQVPRAIIHLKQGIGRLLRSSADRGIIVIFDTRLFTKSYGRLFLQSLPPYRIVNSIDALDAFFRETVADR